MLKAGIVGLPNVGKSTLFNAVTRTRKAEAANYPFCTIDPNVGVVTVPDERLAVLQKIAKTNVVIPAAIEFVDIAGLVKGASAGEGLGNKFLTHIREVDAIVQVVRCFEDADIHHVSGSVDPVRDIEVINTELVLADLEAVKKRREKIARDVKRGDKTAVAEDAVLAKFEPARPVEITAYVSPSVPEDYTQTRLTLLNMLRQFERLGRGKVKVQIVSTEPKTDAAALARHGRLDDARFALKGLRTQVNRYRQPGLEAWILFTTGML